MRAVDTVLRQLEHKPLFSHRARQRSFFAALGGLLRGQNLGLTAMGRASGPLVNAKHNIKRVDRLLGNPKVAQELIAVYRATVDMLELGSHPIILVDWTHLDSVFSALVGAIPVDGRSIPILATVHRNAKAGNQRAERAWLDALAEILPEGTTPILITDAGYQTPWVREVNRRGWHFVTRLSGHVTIAPRHAAERRQVSCLYAEAGNGPTDLGPCQVTKSAKFPQRVVMAPRFRRNPKRKSAPRRYDQRGRGHQRTRVRSQQPWVLATSLMDIHAQQVLELYALRMRIEETFRDAKNSRFGWSMGQCRASTAPRWSVLLALATLATMILNSVGAIAEKAGLHRRLQANTRKERVLSLFYLGALALTAQVPVFLRFRHWLRQARILVATCKRDAEWLCGDP